MTTLNILTHPNPILKQKCETITQFDSALTQLANDMLETMDTYNGIGLAGPQVGILERILVVGHKKRRFCLINPELIHAEGVTYMEEGCLSLPKIQRWVQRYETIFVKAQDLSGKEIQLNESGLISIVIQHEMDHLEGILTLDKDPVDPEKIRKIEESYDAD